ncbi:acyl-CoA carboxylase subunit epsilon [Rathayibacter sp. VKM Ac-2835]|uniref:acyl-CoA carboxylase subunit epsilon n=1 Tax=Rathayibacter sp. VKM Ac-2835 TaxID=2739043 RepID=UPI001563A5BE|nr:acyl-CoA carboxylase subunit epsilon [Rathayibacter sp. VKM Ac-2835]NRG39997.1 acyl-CoA carboxylase subunit epsilon [Rathayibacter sp. VKM Ac-2835]
MSAADSAPSVVTSPAVVIGTPGLDAREIAAVTAVVTALAAQSHPVAEVPVMPSGGWSDRVAAVRAPLQPAPGAWRSFSG